jgi:hypothetical protein
MKRISAILVSCLVTIAALGLASCSSTYIVSLPITVASGAVATGFGDSTILDAAPPLTASTTINVPTLASANFVDPAKVKSVKLNYTYIDHNWWARIYLAYSVDGGTPVVFKVVDNGAGDPQTNGAKTGSVIIPYGGTGLITISNAPLAADGSVYKQSGGVTAFGDAVLNAN